MAYEKKHIGIANKRESKNGGKKFITGTIVLDDINNEWVETVWNEYKSRNERKINIAIWPAESQAGKKYLQITMQPPFKKDNQQSPPPGIDTTPIDDDSIPF